MPKQTPKLKKSSPTSNLAKTLRERAAKRAAKGVPIDSSYMTKAQRIEAGLQPRKRPKLDAWAKLSKQKKQTVIAASKLYAEQQIAMGVPKEHIYGPYAVLEWNARWEWGEQWED